MSFFSIGVFPMTCYDTRLGFIKFGSEVERLSCTIGMLSIEDYLFQWESSLRALAENAEDTAILVENVIENEEYVNCWPFYRNGENVVFRNSVLKMRDLGGSDYRTWRAPAYRASDCSEWSATVNDLREFLSISSEG